MKRFILFTGKLLLLSLLPLLVFGGDWNKNNYRIGYEYNGLKADSIFISPSDTIKNKRSGSIALLNNKLYVSDGSKWHDSQLSVDTINKIATKYDVSKKLNISDTTNKWLPVTTKYVRTVNMTSGDILIDKNTVGLSNVDNTSDANKPISTATQTALNGKADTAYVKNNSWSINGNSGTSSSNFIGTTDNKNLIFKANNVNSGLISPTNYSTALGYNTNGDGSFNTSVGSFSMGNSYETSGNTAIGSNTLYGASGNNNTTVGYLAFKSGSFNGNSNVGVGFNVGQSQRYGDSNTYIGSESASNPSYSQGNQNTFIGANTSSLSDATTNETILGYGITGHGSNTVTIGNSSVTNTYLRGIIHSSNDTVAYLSNVRTKLSISDTTKFRTTSNNLYEYKLPATPSYPETKFLNGNRQWSDISVGNGGYAANLYNSTSASTIVGGYLQLKYVPDATETQFSNTINNQEILFRSYLYEDTISTNTIDAGQWNGAFTAMVNNSNGITQLKFEPFVRHVNGTETTLFSFYSPEINNTDMQTIRMESAQPLFNVSGTDRLGIRVYGKTTSNSNITITVIIGDGRGGYFAAPLRIRHNQLRNLNSDPNYQHVTTTQISTWNNKQSALGYTSENIANKGIANGYTPLDASAKISTTYLPSVVLGAMKYQGTYDASIGSYPSSPAQGNYWVVSVAGTISSVAYKMGDWMAYNGTGWNKIDNQQTVSSVFGRTGAVTAVAGDYTTDQVTEGSTNKYYTDTRARAAISLTTTGNSGASTYSSGVLNVPNYTLSGLGGQSQLNGTGFVKANGTTVSYDNTSYLSGSGTNGQVAFYSGTNTQTSDSKFFWDNTNKRLGINTTSPSSPFTLQSPSVSYDGGNLGSELLSSSNWTSTGWTGDFTNGFLHTTENTTALTNTLVAVIGNFYQITYTITGRTTGSITISFGGQSQGSVLSTGSFGPKAITTDNLSILPTSDFNGTVILSIKQITASLPVLAIKDNAGGVVYEIRSSINSLNNDFKAKNSAIHNTTGNSNSVGAGANALQNNTTGNSNSVGAGANALQNNTAGNSNSVGAGANALQNNTTGFYNSVGAGANALQNNTTGFYNSVGAGANALLNNTTGNYTTADGYNAGRYIANGATGLTVVNNGLFLGANTKAKQDNSSNETVIGYSAIGNGSNTVTIGNSSVTDNYFSGNVNATKFIPTGGTSSKFLKGDGSLDSNSYLTGNQNITLSGDVTGSGTTSITTTLANSGVTAGTYKSVAVDAKGRVTAGTNPTTLSGYGITDAAKTDGSNASGTWPISISGNAAIWCGAIYGGTPNNDLFGLMGYNTTENKWTYYYADYIKSWLGLGSNAYTNTAYLPLTGGSVSGNLTAPSITLTTGAGANKVLTSDASGNATWQTDDGVNETPNTYVMTSSFVLGESNMTSNSIIFVDSSSDITIQMPASGWGSWWKAGQSIAVCRKGTGNVTFVTNTGSTIASRSGYTKIKDQFGWVSVTYGPDDSTFYLAGNLGN